MFRFSDLTDNDKPTKPPPTPQPPAPPEPPQIPGPPAAQPPPLKLAPKSGAGESEQASGRLYEELLACVKRLFEQARAGQSLDLTQAWRLVEQLPAATTKQCQALLVLLERHSQENYLYSHAVNVAMLASHLGRCLGYPPEAVHRLALAGLLLDIGMAGEAERLASLPRKLTAEEWEVIARHPMQALEALKTTREVPQDVLEAIRAHHQRPDGSGYPAEAESQTALEFGKILAVCDVYDALTHPRAHRNRFSPAQAIKVLVDGANTKFDRRVVKVLVDELSLYPRGSAVRLSTNEVGRVDQVRPEAPLRPVVLVSRDANQVPLPAPRRVDLLEQPFVYIKEVVADEEA